MVNGTSLQLDITSRGQGWGGIPMQLGPMLVGGVVGLGLRQGRVGLYSEVQCIMGNDHMRYPCG